jgi:hypothetical protein
MRKTIYKLAVVLALLAIGSSSVLAGGVEGNINMILGQKYLDEDDWAPVEDQAALGVMFDITPAGSPIAFAIDIIATEDSADVYDPFDDIYYEATGETREIDLGIRWYTPPSAFRGYIGGGLALINAEITVSEFGYEASEDDDAVGFFINGGFVVTLARHLNLGLNARYSQAEVDIAGYEIEAGGLLLAGLVGFHF